MTTSFRTTKKYVEACKVDDSLKDMKPIDAYKHLDGLGYQWDSRQSEWSKKEDVNEGVFNVLVKCNKYELDDAVEYVKECLESGEDWLYVTHSKAYPAKDKEQKEIPDVAQVYMTFKKMPDELEEIDTHQ